MDVLSDVLRAVRLTGAVYFDVRARAPWVAETPAASSIFNRAFKKQVGVPPGSWRRSRMAADPAR